MLEAEEEGTQSEDALAEQSEEAAETVTEEADEFEGESEEDERQSGQPKSYAAFMEKIGGRFKVANEAKWLGGDIVGLLFHCAFVNANIRIRSHSR